MEKIFDSRDERYRSPYGAVPLGTTVEITFKPPVEWAASRVIFVVWHDFEFKLSEIPMTLETAGEEQDVWRVSFDTSGKLGPLWYHFRMEYPNGGAAYYGNNERSRGGTGQWYNKVPPGYQMTVYLPDYSVPDWYGEGVTYQIFPDRFRRGAFPTERNGRVFHRKWDETPVFLPDFNGEVKNDDFFGGTLEGVRSKLEFLSEMGVTTIYLNPIFEAESNHRYDTGDYMKIDPTLGTEEDFKRLCADARKLGIRVILDGVFNHTGFNSRYFNGRGQYPGPGAYQSRDSEYYPWYNFHGYPDCYESWWGIYTLPRVNKSAGSFVDFIASNEDSVVRHWIRAGASGWRLDVADELTDDFIEEIRRAIREEIPDGILIGEVWEDATNKISYGQRRQYLLGKGLDSVMNYPFRNALIAFLLGGDAREFVEEQESIRENYPKKAFMSLMNLIGTHDSPRALTVLGCREESYNSTKEERANFRLSPDERKLGIARMKLAAAIQFSFPGSPLVYYGDEAGMEGYEDPLNRRTYPWDGADEDLLRWYRRLGGVRKYSEALHSGEIEWLYAKDAALVYRRRAGKETVVVAVNRGFGHEHIEIGYKNGETMIDLISGASVRVSRGKLRLHVAPLSAMFLHGSG